MGKVDTVKFYMKKPLCVGMSLDQTVYDCGLLRYDKKQECLYLLATTDLEAFSLDAVYVCEMKSQEKVLQCTGRVKERYVQKEEKVIKFEIENGFYKKNIKTVDK